MRTKEMVTQKLLGSCFELSGRVTQKKWAKRENNTKQTKQHEPKRDNKEKCNITFSVILQQ